MPQAKRGSTVKVHYTGMLQDGTIFDTTAGKEPFHFTIGQGDIIPGFEEALIGMSQGEERTVTIPAEKAHGKRSEHKVIHLEQERFPPGFRGDVGQEFTVKSPKMEYSVKIVDNQVIVDTNPELAGKDLIYTIKLVEIL